MIHFIITSFLLLLTYHLGLHPLYAQDMTSQNYKLQGGNLNTSSQAQSSSGYRLVDLVGQTNAQIFTSKGYLIQSGFLNKASTSFLSFSVSPALVNFGSLTPEKAKTDNLLITLSSGNFPGYQVYVAQNKPLSTEANAQIPDTICDAGSNKICSKDKGNIWQEDSSYGFGYNLQGKSVVSDFTGSQIFRPFASLSKKEQPVLIMESAEKNLTETAGMLLKIIVSKTQPVGIYQNILSFTAMPGI